MPNNDFPQYLDLPKPDPDEYIDTLMFTISTDLMYLKRVNPAKYDEFMKELIDAYNNKKDI